MCCQELELAPLGLGPFGRFGRGTHESGGVACCSTATGSQVGGRRDSHIIGHALHGARRVTCARCQAMRRGWRACRGWRQPSLWRGSARARARMAPNVTAGSHPAPCWTLAKRCFATILFDGGKHIRDAYGSAFGADGPLRKHLLINQRVVHELLEHRVDLCLVGDLARRTQ